MELFSLRNKRARAWYSRGLVALVAVAMVSIPVLSTILMMGCAPAQRPPQQPAANYSLLFTNFTAPHTGQQTWQLQLRRNGNPVVGAATFSIVGTPSTGLSLSSVGALTAETNFGTTGTINVSVQHGNPLRTVIASRTVTVTRAAPPGGNGNGPGNGNGTDPGPDRNIVNQNVPFMMPVDFTYVSRWCNTAQDWVATRDGHFGTDEMDYVTIPFGTLMETQSPAFGLMTVNRNDPHVFYYRHAGVAFCNMGAVWHHGGGDHTRDIFAARIGEVVEVRNNVGNFDNGKQFGWGNYIIVRHRMNDWDAASNMVTMSLRHVGPIIRTSTNDIIMYTKYANLLHNGVFVEVGDIVGGMPGQTFRDSEGRVRETSRPYGVPIGKMGRTGFTGNDDRGAVDQLYFSVYKYMRFPRLVGQDEEYRVYLDPLSGEALMFINMRDKRRAVDRARRANQPWVYIQEATGGHLMAEMFIWAGADAGLDVGNFMEMFLPESINQFVKDSKEFIEAGTGIWNNAQTLYNGVRTIWNTLNGLDNQIETQLIQSFNAGNGNGGSGVNVGGIRQNLTGWMTPVFNGLRQEINGLIEFFSNFSSPDPTEEAEAKLIMAEFELLRDRLDSDWNAKLDASADAVLARLTAAVRSITPRLISSFKSYATQTLGIGNSENFAGFATTIATMGPQEFMRVFTMGFYREFIQEFRREMNAEFQKSGMALLMELQKELFGSVLINNEEISGVSTPSDFFQLSFSTASNRIMERAGEAEGQQIIYQNRFNEVYNNIAANVSSVLTGNDLPGGNNTRLTTIITGLNNRTHPITRGTVGQEEFMNALQDGIAREMRKFANRIGATVPEVVAMNHAILPAILANGSGVYNPGQRTTMLARLIVFNEVALVRFSTGITNWAWGEAFERIESAQENINTHIKTFRMGLTPFTSALTGDFSGILQVVTRDVNGGMSSELDSFNEDAINTVRDDPSSWDKFIAAGSSILGGLTDGTYWNMVNNMRSNLQGIFRRGIDLEDLGQMFGFLAIGMDTWISTETIDRICRECEKPSSECECEFDLGAQMNRIFTDMTRSIQRAFNRHLDELTASMMTALGEMTFMMVDLVGDLTTDLATFFAGDQNMMQSILDNVGIIELTHNFVASHQIDGSGIGDRLATELIYSGQMDMFMQTSLVELLLIRERGIQLTEETKIEIDGNFEYIGNLLATLGRGGISMTGVPIYELAERLTDDQFDTLIDNIRLHILKDTFDVSFATMDQIAREAMAATGGGLDRGDWEDTLIRLGVERVTQFMQLYAATTATASTWNNAFNFNNNTRVIVDHQRREVRMGNLLPGGITVANLLRYNEEDFILGLRYMLERLRDREPPTIMGIEMSALSWSRFNGTDPDPTKRRIETIIAHISELYGFGGTRWDGRVDRNTWVRINMFNQTVRILEDGLFRSAWRNFVNSPVVQFVADVVVSAVIGAVFGALYGLITAGPAGVIAGAIAGAVEGAVTQIVYTATTGNGGLASGVMQNVFSERIRYLNMGQAAAATGFVSANLNNMGLGNEGSDKMSYLSAYFLGDALDGILEDFGRDMHEMKYGSYDEDTGERIMGIVCTIRNLMTGEDGESGLVGSINEFMNDRVAAMREQMGNMIDNLKEDLIDQAEVFQLTMERIINDALEDAIEQVKMVVLDMIIDMVSNVFHDSLGDSLGRAIGFILPPAPLSFAFHVNRGIAINIGKAILAWFGAAEWEDVVYPVVRNTPWFTTFRPGLLVNESQNNIGRPPVSDTSRQTMINQAYRALVIDTLRILEVRQTTEVELAKMEQAISDEFDALVEGGQGLDWYPWIEDRLNAQRNRVMNAITDVQVQDAFDIAVGWGTLMSTEQKLRTLVSIIYLDRLAVLEFNRLMNNYVAA